jgi:large subunit ribosomal protein L4
MAEVEIKNLANEVVGTVELSDEVFKAKLNETLIWEAVKHYQDSLRSGTAATKTRAMVSGSGKKPWRQKGTGRARVGEIRNPLWRHGGTVHGPQPRDYSYRFPRKKLRGALRSALSAKLEGNSLTIVDGFALEGNKTKDLLKILRALSGDGKVLIVDSADNRNLMLSSRNLPNVKLVPSTRVNIYDLVNYKAMVVSKDAILQIQEVLSS